MAIQSEAALNQVLETLERKIDEQDQLSKKTDKTDPDPKVSVGHALEAFKLRGQRDMMRWVLGLPPVSEKRS